MKKHYVKFLALAVFFMMAIPSANAMQDKEYKKALIKSSGHPEYTLKNMKPIIGEKELTKVLKRYDNHPEKYQSDWNKNRDLEGVKHLTFRSSLHSHTVFSDGTLTPTQTIDQAAEYGNKVKAKHPFEKYPMIIAITDHFTTKGTLEAIDAIQKDPKKYKNIKFVAGMETEVFVKTPSQNEKKPLHMLVWCINPYEWPFNETDYHEPSDNIYHVETFDEFAKRMNQLEYGLVSIAHPLRFFDKDDTTDTIIDEMFSTFETTGNGKQLFTEGYYQPYRFKIDKDLYDRTAENAKKHGIVRTGSQDAHGKTIFNLH